jgi:hypothetical protein
MSSYRFREVLRLILLLLVGTPEACAVARAGPTHSSSLGSVPSGSHDLSGVWIGTSVTGCTPLRMDGPWRCGAKADIMLTFLPEDPAAAANGIYASERSGAGDDFQETGRIVEEPFGGPTGMWLRVFMANHSSCLFNSKLHGEVMAGNYICFREGTSFERGRWAARLSY